MIKFHKKSATINLGPNGTFIIKVNEIPMPFCELMKILKMTIDHSLRFREHKGKCVSLTFFRVNISSSVIFH